MVIKNELNNAIISLKQHGNQNSVFEAHLIFRHFLNMTPTDLVLNGTCEIDQNVLDKINTAILRRNNKEPLQYILNSQEFMGLDFYVDENVLVPRADTETLVEYLLEKFLNKSFTALEIGTGSGCISVSLAHYNKNAYIRGIDISKKAVEISINNATKNNVSERTIFENADIFNYKCYGKYDLIVSNPPYIETDVINKLDVEVKNHEPIVALDGGGDGLKFYRHIIEIAPTLLNDKGMIAFEVGINQSSDVFKLLEKDFSNIKIIKDLCGVERVVSAELKN